MSVTHDRTAHADLRRIPGVGPGIAGDLAGLGVERVKDLEGRDPNGLYEALCTQRGERIDRCVLYVFRCAVYFAESPRPEIELLKWWNWKDRAHANERGFRRSGGLGGDG